MWFRFDSDTLDNRKAQALEPRLFKVWVNLLCLANESRQRGCLPPEKDIAFRLRLSAGECKQAIAALKKAKLLEQDPGGCLRMHDWDEYQRPLSNAERQALYRSRHAAVMPRNDGVTKSYAPVTTVPYGTLPDQDHTDSFISLEEYLEEREGTNGSQ